MHITNLVSDIYDTIKNNKSGFTDEWCNILGASVAQNLRGHFSNERSGGTLRLSKMGDQCPRALWYSVHHPELAEELPPQAMIKYSFGHMIEAQTIALAKAAGHRVEGEQDELVVDGVHGHRDCVIDGNVVDVKSCSGRTFDKIKSGEIGKDDSFGYLDQLDGYLVGSLTDGLVLNKDSAFILGVHKELGHICLYEHYLRETRIRERIRLYKQIVSLDRPPECACEEVSSGESGNIALGVRASYSAFKFECFPQLRTFIQAKGPIYLTKCVKHPQVKGPDGKFRPALELDRYGKAVYH